MFWTIFSLLSSHLYKMMCIASAKLLEQEGASHHPVFLGNCPTIGHTFLALSTQWMSFPSRKWRRGVSPRYCLILLCLVGELPPVWGKRGEGAMWLSVCGVPFNDWVSGSSYFYALLKRVLNMVLVMWGVDPILRNGYGNQGQKVCCIAPGEWKVSGVVLQAFGISYSLL